MNTVKKVKTLEGKVVSNKMHKTAVVVVTRRVKHPLLGKVITKSSKYKIHDEKNDCGIGDTVLISECRPLSKDKSWTLNSIVERHKD